MRRFDSGFLKRVDENVLVAETLSLLQSHKLGFVHYFVFNSEYSCVVCSPCASVLGSIYMALMA